MEIIDKSNMRQIILDFPKQFKVGLEAAKDVGRPRDVRRPKAVIVCGMGGSALPGDILSIWLENNKISLPLHIHRDYGLPYYADGTHLVICISYSGNTEETLSALEEARKRNLKILAIASGGKLAEICKSHNIPVAIIPAGLQPRSALGFQFAALMKIMANSGLIQSNLKDVSNLGNLLKPQISENQGRKLAKKIKNKIPLIYSSRKFQYLARIWKIKFNENSKIPAFYNCFPELNHNEHNQFERMKNGKFQLVILRDKTENPKILKRMALLTAILRPKKIPAQFIDIEGENMLYKVFNNILLSDWASYYLALEYKIDPTPVKLNDEFKRRLAK